MTTDTPTQYTFFFGHTKPNGYLSQHAGISFYECGLRFQTAEHYMMYHKGMLFGDEHHAKLALTASDPGEAKKYGRLVNGFDHKVWDQKKVSIVTRGNILKFTQNPKFADRLLLQSNFVEASPYDRIWGIGIDSHSALAHKDQWGQNLLGQVLETVKASLILTKAY